MTWKNFFKPTIAKAVLLIIILLAISFLKIWPIMGCGVWECWPGIGTFWDSIRSFENKEFFDAGMFNGFFYLSIFLLIVSYFLSCAIAFVYGIMHHGVKQHHEQKKKKNKKRKK